MAQTKTQTFANHTRFDPAFHFFAAPVSLTAFVYAVTRLVHNFNGENAWWVLFAAGFVVTTFLTRVTSLRVQDRLIRLEETLRMQRVLPAALQTRIGELTLRQLIALRFASDSELPALVQQALDNKWGAKETKQAIQDWRADHCRA